MEQNKPYGIAPLENRPIDPDRLFAQQTSDKTGQPGYAVGIVESEGRKFAQGDPYATGDERLKARQRSQESLDWSKKIDSRSMTRNTRADLNWAITPSGGGIGG